MSKREGGMWGLLIGDALGVPYEFKEAGEIPRRSLIEMIPPVGTPKTYDNVPEGTWSDDGAQALVLLDTLLNDSLDTDHFWRGMKMWQTEGYMTPDGRVFDIGNQTYFALEHYNGEGLVVSERSNGNGSLMRTLPCALVARDVEEAILLAMKQSKVTHPHPRAQFVCALYCVIAFHLLHEVPRNEAVEKAFEDVLRICPDAETELKCIKEWDTRDGTGYVVDCFWSAITVLKAWHSYEDTVRGAILYGNDTDTTAAVAGGLAGILYGVEGIPQRWMDTLKGKHIAGSLIAKLRSAHG